MIIVFLLVGGSIGGRFFSTLQVQKIDEELIPLDKAPIVSTEIKLTPEQELLAASIKSKEDAFNGEIDKLESVILEQVQRCLAIAVEEQVLQSTAQEPEMGSQQFLVAQLNVLLAQGSPVSTEEKSQSEKKEEGSKKDKGRTSSSDPLKSFNVSASPVCAGIDRNFNLLVAISAYKNKTDGEGSTLLIEGLNIPASSLLDPVAGDVREVGISNIKASYEAFTEAREKWESSHRISWESESE